MAEKRLTKLTMPYEILIHAVSICMHCHRLHRLALIKYPALKLVAKGEELILLILQALYRSHDYIVNILPCWQDKLEDFVRQLTLGKFLDGRFHRDLLQGCEAPCSNRS